MLANCAVINAGPLVALSLADRLDLLPALFGEFWIPEPVYHEVTVAGWGRPGAKVLAAPDLLSRVSEAPTPCKALVATSKSWSWTTATNNKWTGFSITNLLFDGNASRRAQGWSLLRGAFFRFDIIRCREMLQPHPNNRNTSATILGAGRPYIQR